MLDAELSQLKYVPVGGAAWHFPLLIPVKNDTQRHLPDNRKLPQLDTKSFS